MASVCGPVAYASPIRPIALVYVALGEALLGIGVVSETENQKPSTDMVKRVRDAFLIFDSDMLAELESFETKSTPASNLIMAARDGLRSVVSAGSLPFQLVADSSHQRRFDQIHTAERIRSLKYIEFGTEPSEELAQQSAQTARHRMSDFVKSQEGINYFRDQIIGDLYHRLNSPEVEDAALELRVQTLISTWTVFESAVRAFIINWINANPQRALPVLASPELKTYFGKQVVDITVINDFAFDLTSSMGDILFGDRRLDNLQVIRHVLEALFNNTNIREKLADDIWILNQRRHLFVHRRGLIDAEYLRRTGDPVPVGERLCVTSGDIEHYINAVKVAFLAIASAADNVS